MKHNILPSILLGFLTVILPFGVTADTRPESESCKIGHLPLRSVTVIFSKGVNERLVDENLKLNSEDISKAVRSVFADNMPTTTSYGIDLEIEVTDFDSVHGRQQYGRGRLPATIQFRLV